MDANCSCCACVFVGIEDPAWKNDNFPPTEYSQSVVKVGKIDPSTISFTVAGSATLFDHSASVIFSPIDPVVGVNTVGADVQPPTVRPPIGWPYVAWFRREWVPAIGTQFTIEGYTSWHYYYSFPIASTVRLAAALTLDDKSILCAPERLLFNTYSQSDDITAHRWLPHRETNAGLLTVRKFGAGGAVYGAEGTAGPIYNRKVLTNPPAINFGCFNVPVSLIGNSIAVYRDEELVFSGNRSNAGPTDYIAATGQPGSYFVVSKTNSGDSCVNIKFGAFTVSTTLPVFGFGPLNDAFADFGPQWTRRYTIATKPYKGPYDDVFIDGSTVAPERRPWQNLPSSVGVHVLDIMPQDKKDIYGNLATYVYRPEYRVHAVPANDRRGATPSISDPGYETIPYYAPRPQSQRVSELRLSFDRKVKSDTVSAGQFAFTVNGNSVSGVEIEEIGDSGRNWIVRVPTDAQTPRTFCVLTYRPAGTMTDDIATLTYESASQFPPLAQAAYRTVYVDLATGKRYSKAPAAYVDIGDGPPRDRNGVAYEPEACLLACRVGWMMNGDEVFPQLIDVRYSTAVLGYIPSVSSDFSEDEWPDEFSASSSEYRYFFSTAGYYTEKEATGYVPRVPQQEDFDDDCSYFGLTTSIHPCPPRAFDACSVPRKPQIHSSVIRSEREIVGFTVTPPEYAPPEGDPQPGDTSQVAGEPVTASLAGEMTFSNTEDGQTIQQNVWMCSQSGASREAQYLKLDPRETEPFTVEQEGVNVHATIRAYRGCRTYDGMSTSMLDSLYFYLRAIIGVEETISHDGYDEDPPIPPKQWDNSYVLMLERTFALSEGDEDSLAAGSDVTVGGWTIKAQFAD